MRLTFVCLLLRGKAKMRGILFLLLLLFFCGCSEGENVSDAGMDARNVWRHPCLCQFLKGEGGGKCVLHSCVCY